MAWVNGVPCALPAGAVFPRSSGLTPPDVSTTDVSTSRCQWRPRQSRRLRVASVNSRSGASAAQGCQPAPAGEEHDDAEDERKDATDADVVGEAAVKTPATASTGVAGSTYVKLDAEADADVEPDAEEDADAETEIEGDKAVPLSVQLVGWRARTRRGRPTRLGAGRMRLRSWKIRGWKRIVRVGRERGTDRNPAHTVGP